MNPRCLWTCPCRCCLQSQSGEIGAAYAYADYADYAAGSADSDVIPSPPGAETIDGSETERVTRTGSWSWSWSWKNGRGAGCDPVGVAANGAAGAAGVVAAESCL